MGRKEITNGVRITETDVNLDIQNAWVELLLRWFIGGLFIYASIHKILEPSVFAKIIYGYDLFPHALINLIAIILPYIEFITGLFLITGIFPKGAALIIDCLLVMFIIIISINLVRGHEFDCGCFTNLNRESQHMPSSSLLVRDIFYLATGLYVLFYQKKRKFCLFAR